MEKAIKNMAIMLKNKGKVVVKISESKVKKIKIDTGKYLTIIAENNGFKLKDVFLDKISENSRSLTTARNTYSDIIVNDNNKTIFFIIYLILYCYNDILSLFLM